MRVTHRTYSVFTVLASATMLIGCGEDVATGPPNDGPAPGGDPPTETALRVCGVDSGTVQWDLTIPCVPVPTSPQPVAQVATDTGAIVKQDRVPGPLQVTLVGVFQQQLVCDPDFPFDSGGIDVCGTSPLYGNLNGEFLAWADTTGAKPLHITLPSGATQSLCSSIDDARHLKSNGTWVTTRSRQCLTFHDIELTREVDIRHVRYWVNVGSRVLGPGTDYSITLTWTEGVETSNGFEFNSTRGQTSIDETTWNKCTSESFKFTAQQNISIGGVFKALTGGIELNFEESEEKSEEECYGGKSARETSTTLSETFDERRTVTHEESVEETTSVTGADDADRVYTVWQLVDRYIYLNPDSSVIKPATLLQDPGYTSGLGATNIPVLTPDDVGGAPGDDKSFYFPDGSPRAFGEWRPVAVSWPVDGTLDQMTELFVQQTTDFPLGSGTAAAAPSELRVVSY